MKQKQIINKTQHAYEFLKTRILDGQYGPGKRIVIDQIAKELGLSTIPVREAIRRLEADGLVQNKPYSGAIVSAIDETEYVETLSVLAVLEGYATALSSRNITQEQIKNLNQLNMEMEEALKNFELEQFQKLNYQFHSIIYEECGNQFLKEEIRQIQQRVDRVRRSIFTFVPKRALESIREHYQIIQLLKEKASLNGIETLARDHKMNTIVAFQEREF
ncbi:GntR family transcriptional regulator [Bacillus sp. B190/17]|uniref:GntR family transcriptional regulator n=1 Tax=Bacillus lumedeiriae TaxID=3058829 RepID=A0ABW8IB72_9BACI